MPPEKSQSRNCSLLAPWMSMNLTYANYCGLGCCNNHIFSTPFKSTTDFRIDEIWNNEAFQELRRRFRENRLSGSGCEQCAYSADGPESHLKEPTSERQRANFRRALEHGRNMDTVVESSPVIYNICPSGKCNLRCIMCGERDRQMAFPGQEIPFDLLMRSADAFSLAQFVMVSGGEPFASRETARFIRELARNPKFSGTKLGITTNGQLMDRQLDDLREKESLLLAISIDAMGERYPTIRRGGTWDRVATNVGSLMEMREKHARTDWTIHCNVVLMKSSLPGLPDLLRWALGQGFDDFNLIPLEPTFETWGEDLLQNRGLLAAIPDYDALLAESVDILEKHGLESSGRSLREYAERLRTPTPPEQRVIAANRMGFNEFFETAKVEGKRVAIWGTGSFYRTHTAEWLRRHAGTMEFLGFIDNNAKAWGRTCDGFPIRSPEDLRQAGLEPDYLIIAAYIGYKDKIIAQYRSLGFTDTIII